MRSQEQLQEIIAEVYDLLKQKCVTLHEMEHIFGEAGRMARTSEEMMKLYS